MLWVDTIWFLFFVILLRENVLIYLWCWKVREYSISRIIWLEFQVWWKCESTLRGAYPLWPIDVNSIVSSIVHGRSMSLSDGNFLRLIQGVLVHFNLSICLLTDLYRWITYLHACDGLHFFHTLVYELNSINWFLLVLDVITVRIFFVLQLLI